MVAGDLESIGLGEPPHASVDMDPVTASDRNPVPTVTIVPVPTDPDRMASRHPPGFLDHRPSRRLGCGRGAGKRRCNGTGLRAKAQEVRHAEQQLILGV